MAPREKTNGVKGRNEFRGSKAKTNFPLPSENNNINQSPSQSSTVESSSPEGLSPAPIGESSPFDLNLLDGVSNGDVRGSAVPFPFYQQARVLPISRPLFLFDAMFRSEKMNYQNRLRFDPAVADCRAGGIQSDSDSSPVDFKNHKVLGLDLNLPPPPEYAGF
ncbi:hypothetical protein HHK36_023618 [Tetracentron sinense]|uniref:Uncharacterized protein n=1 Tax=Tetracentron sinense TaxID=13715 RepID=A0A834YLP6_TETSI|nr:hypothetical protein HHK36_023618 [Tetracentron sinense]